MPRDHRDTIEHPVPTKTAQRQALGLTAEENQRIAAALGLHTVDRLEAAERQQDARYDHDLEARWDAALAQVLADRER